MKVVIRYKKLSEKAQAPWHAHEDDRGFDLFATSKVYENGVFKFGCGLAFEFPEGIDAELRARSSVYKTGLILSNGVGTIDHGYRGEVMAVFYSAPVVIPVSDYNIGDRFAQIVIPGVDPRNVIFEEVEELSNTARGEGGYGSTGKNTK